MIKFLSRDQVLLALTFLAVVQITLVGLRRGSGEGPSDSWFRVGDTLSGIRAFDSDGDEASMEGGEPTVVLVFHSECGHCENVAPLWKAWTTAFGPGFRTVAISSEPPESARAYVSRHEWDAEVWTVEGGELGSPEHGLTSRTPWVFVLNRAGVIMAESHGQSIDEVGALFGAKLQEAPG